MLSDVEKDNNLILMRLNPVATLFGMLQGRKNEISLRNWSGITAHLRGDVVYGVLKTKIQSRKSVSFYPLIWAISQLNRITTVV